MRLRFWGAARTVTGSAHLVEYDGGRVLLDCGLFQGRRAEARERNNSFPIDPGSVDAVLLSHAHIDHSGLLPAFHREGFRGKVYATHATADLCGAMLRDSAFIHEKDAEWLNKRERRRGRERIEPLYGMEDAEAVLEHFEGVDYDASFSPLPGLEVEYRDAGHILGSATMVLTVREGTRTVKLGFTGDVGRPGRPILRDPRTMADCDYLITESTYGGEVHEPSESAKERLAEVVGRTAARGGKVIIPAFAVGRTQEIVHNLDQLENEGRLPPIPMFVDSPLAVNVTEIFRAHPECFDPKLVAYMEDDPKPFGFDRLTYIRDVEDSKKLNGARLPMVIISASGMCEAGRILHHLRNNIEDSRNTVMMVGYAAPHTLGRRIIERQPEVRIFGQPHKLKAEVEVMNAYSAHADEPELLEFIGRLDRQRLRRIFLVHGDPDRQAALTEALGGQGYTDVVSPERGDSYEL
ncbi:MAG: MBL fold metallo-hydrolase [Gemmatimonadota bacterium]